MTLHCDTYNQNLLTIIPIYNGHKPIEELIAPKQPDLTFHCSINDCNQYFSNILLLYQHMNGHPESEREPSPSSAEKDKLDEDNDYSWVLEPVCELVSSEMFLFSKVEL